MFCLRFVHLLNSVFALHDIILVGLGDETNMMFWAMARLLAYFGFTVGDHSPMPEVDPSGDVIPLENRNAAAPRFDALGFEFILTLPRPRFSICGWKKNDLYKTIDKLVRIRRGGTATLDLPSCYKTVGRLLWLRYNCWLYVPNLGPLSYCELDLVRRKRRSWKISHGDRLWHCLREILAFLKEPWLIIAPALIRIDRRTAVYTERTVRSNACSFRL